MDCAEGEDVNLPCNHSTIGGNDYIHWYRQNPNQSPQCVIHGFRDSERQHGLSEHSFRQKVQHPGPAPGHPERRRCVLLRPERGTLGQTGLHLCSISLVGRRGDIAEGAVTRANLESKESQRAVRDEENEGKEKGRRCIKKRKGQGRSASLVDVAEKNYGATKNPRKKVRSISNFSWFFLVSIKCWFQCVSLNLQVRKIQIVLLVPKVSFMWTQGKSRL